MNLEIWWKIDTKTCAPDIVGEYLRELFFVESYHGKYRNLGCYSEFGVNPAYASTPEEHLDANGNVWFTARSNDNIVMTYMWDGDGVLAFIFPDNTVVYNTDCKKTHGWRRDHDAKAWVDSWTELYDN
jgi:hypothetical protein